jgi:nuclear pore complex protein Nup93
VGTGSARACLIDDTGDIKALASENIQLWQPAAGYEGSHYVRHAPHGLLSRRFPDRSTDLLHGQEQSTTDIWKAICTCVKRVVAETLVDTSTIKGLGFDATCSLAVFSHDSDEPVPVTGPDFANDGNDRTVTRPARRKDQSPLLEGRISKCITSSRTPSLV